MTSSLRLEREFLGKQFEILKILHYYDSCIIMNMQFSDYNIETFSLTFKIRQTVFQMCGTIIAKNTRHMRLRGTRTFVSMSSIAHEHF